MLLSQERLKSLVSGLDIRETFLKLGLPFCFGLFVTPVVALLKPPLLLISKVL